MFSFASRSLAVVLLFSIASPVLALEDSQPNRDEQANNYLKVVSPQSMMEEMTGKLAQTLPVEQQDGFKTLMTKYLDMNHVTAAIHAGLVKTFTADELHALAEFYSSVPGKSAMKKMGEYMAEVMPATMKEVQLAYMRAQAESAKGQPPAEKADQSAQKPAEEKK